MVAGAEDARVAPDDLVHRPAGELRERGVDPFDRAVGAGDEDRVRGRLARHGEEADPLLMPGGHDRQRHLIGEAPERVGIGRVGAREERQRAEDFVVGDERERQHGAEAVRERAVAPCREAGIAVDAAGPQRAAANGRPGRAGAVRRLVPAHDDVVEERRGRTGGGADLHLAGGAFQADLHKGVAV